MPGDGGFRVRGDFPIRFETAEMVDANDVAQREDRTHALDPPAIAFLRVFAPFVERVAPTLSGGAEVVGRHPGDNARVAVALQVEQVLVGPDVGTVRGDEDRHVADDLDAFAVGIRFQLRPLGKEAPLAEAPEITFVGEHREGFGQRLCLALRQGSGPVLPDLAVASITSVQRHEERVVVEPVLFAEAERGKVAPRAVARVGEKASGGASQVLHAEAFHFREVHPSVVETRWRLNLSIGQPVRVAQLGEVDQQLVAGECRGAHVRRVARADAAEWEHLPQGLLGAGQPVNEMESCRTEIAGATRAGKRGRVEKNAAMTRERHGL